jgi:hypothetical protein
MKRETGKLDSLFPTDHREESILKKIVTKTVNYCEFLLLHRNICVFCKNITSDTRTKKIDEDLHI